MEARRAMNSKLKFFWREREFSASPVVIATPTQEFSRQKNPMSNFFPHPIYTLTTYVRSMSSEYHHFAGLCDLKMLWAAIVGCSCHFDEKSHDANNSPNVEVEVTYFVHIFSPPPTLSFFHIVSQHIMRAFAPRLTTMYVMS